MVILDLALALILGGLTALVVTHSVAIWQLFIVALLIGIGQMLSEISSSALVPTIASVKELPRVNGFISTTKELGAGLAGPAMAGLLYAALAALPFGVNACSFLVAGIIVASLARHERAARMQSSTNPATQPADSRLRAGARWVARDRHLRGIILMTAAWSLFGWMPEAVLVLYTKQDLRASSIAFGGLLAVTAAGAVVGGIFSNRLISRLGTARALDASLITYALLMAPPAFMSNLYLVVPVFFLQGIPILIFTVAAATARQTLVPNDMMARVSAIFYVAGAGIAPLGLLAGGFIGSYINLRATFLFGAVGLTASVVSLSRTLKGVDQRMPD
jgi:MFS family permease